MYLIKTNDGKLYATHADNMMDAEDKFDEFQYDIDKDYGYGYTVEAVNSFDSYDANEIIFF